MTKIEYHKKVFDLIKGSPNPLIDASFIEIDNNPFAIQLAQELSIEVERIQNKLRLLTSKKNQNIRINRYLPYS